MGNDSSVTEPNINTIEEEEFNKNQTSVPPSPSSTSSSLPNSTNTSTDDIDDVEITPPPPHDTATTTKDVIDIKSSSLYGMEYREFHICNEDLRTPRRRFGKD